MLKKRLRMLKSNKLNIPEAQPLPGEENVKPIPFSVVADKAFGLSNNVLSIQLSPH